MSITTIENQVTPIATQSPEPEPTRAGLSGGILCIALLIGGILVVKSRSP